MLNKWKEGAALLVLLFLFPYISAVFVVGPGAQDYEIKEPADECLVRLEGETGAAYVNLEEYVLGAAAGVVEPSWHEEMIKAQMILIRTNVIREIWVLEQEGKSVSAAVLSEKYQTPAQVQRRSGSAYKEFLGKLTEASEATAGMTLSYKGREIDGAYHYLSNGSTRGAGTEAFGYFQPADCPEDIRAADFMLRREMELPLWQATLEDAGYDPESQVTIEKRDAQGYVQQVNIGGTPMTGEAFRELFGLRSADFSFVFQEDLVILTTKGVGHGLGMSQHTALKMAEEGKDYETILSYFFQGTELKKTE